MQLDSAIVISDSDDEDNDYLTSESSDERWPLCNIPGCFLEDITLPTSIYVTNFQETKQELVTRLYQLYNTTIFENKLPENMSIIWNKRLTATSAYCHVKSEGDEHYCIINLSEKVCDSAERLRDTLVHEMCHAACWIIDRKLDSDHHGPLWMAYAAKVTSIHPELPTVEAYHIYDINYPFTYQCSLCQCSFGRYRKIADKKIYCSSCKIRHNPMTTGRKDESSSSSFSR
ncbi:germ cell nuclear acidic protein-like isoform X2 [Eleutherodactylus coqui]